MPGCDGVEQPVQGLLVVMSSARMNRASFSGPLPEQDTSTHVAAYKEWKGMLPLVYA